MIYFLTFEAHQYTVHLFKDYTRADSIRILPYESFKLNFFTKNDVIIFCDIDRCTDEKLEVLKSHYNSLISIKCKILNNPHQCLRRFDLLNKLSRLGLNSYKVYRLEDYNEGKIKFPVFLRNQFSHNGPDTPLLYNYSDLKKYIERSCIESSMISEFIDVSNEMTYHKYGAFILNKTIIPRHYFKSDQWNVKSSNLNLHRSIQDELDFINNNPHKDSILQIFRISKIEYGRIDYAIVNSKIVVFEINTNPTIIDQWDIQDGNLRLTATTEFVKNFSKALNKMLKS